jgi:hypothetical protein
MTIPNRKDHVHRCMENIKWIWSEAFPRVGSDGSDSTDEHRSTSFTTTIRIAARMYESES